MKKNSRKEAINQNKMSTLIQIKQKNWLKKSFSLHRIYLDPIIRLGAKKFLKILKNEKN